MKRNIILGILATLLVVIISGFHYLEVDANGYVDGTITIDETFTSGSLGDAIETVVSDLDAVTSLTITEGVVNSTDFNWIGANLIYIEKLEIIENATVDSGTDSSVDTDTADNTVRANRIMTVGEFEYLTEITISSATALGEYAFNGCYELEEVSLPNVVTVGKGAFDSTNLTSISLPLATTLGDNAFAYCLSLKSVSLPNVITVGNGAFTYAEELTSVSLPSATILGDEAFAYCASLESIDLPKVITVSDAAFACDNKLTSVTLPSATTIEDEAFIDCESLESIDLPKVITVGKSAFRDNYSLSSINLPLATTIEYYAFDSCNALESVSLPKVETVGEGAFRQSNLTSISLPSATTLGDSAFYACEVLESVSLPIVETVGDGAFEDAYELTSVSLPYATTIGDKAFSDCFELASVDMPMVETIGIYAFEFNWELTSLEFPELTSLGTGAFLECNVLKSIDIPKLEIIPDSAFENNYSLVSVSAAEATTIETKGFKYASSLTDVYFPKVTTIGSSAFDWCNSLVSIELPSVTSMDSKAFIDCSSLNDLTLGATVPSVQSNTFSNTSTDSPTIRVPYGSATSYLKDTSDGDGTDSEWYGWAIYEMSNDTTLIDLSISTGTLDPMFDSNITEYTIDVTNDITSIEVTPTVTSSATVTMEGEQVTSGEVAEVALSVGANEINIVVTAEDGSTSETVITVMREGNNDATLSGLNISTGALAPTFDSSITDYVVDVTNDIKSIEITPTVTSTATVTVEGEEVTSGEAAEVALSVGTNEINIVVTAEDGSTTSETVITVTRAFSNDVKISALNISSGTLNPTFNSNTTIYEIDVTNDITIIEVTPAVTTNATVTVEGEEVTSGEAAEVALSIGTNEINIVVTAEDGSTTAETVITVIRAGNDDASLSDLSISRGTLDPTFDSSIAEYRAGVANGISSIEVTPIVNDSNATVTVEGEEVISGQAAEVALSVGANEINIVVTAQDGNTTAETILTVTRATSSNKNSGNSSSDSTTEATDTTDIIIEQFESEKGEAVVEVTVEDNETISEDVFETLKEEGGKLVIDGDWYQWEFDGQSEVEEEVNADFEPSIEIVDKDEVDIELDDEKGFIIKTKYEGKLPIKAKIKFKVEKFANDQTVYMYYYNETTGKLELSGTAVNEDGQAEFEITHCSIYTITEKPVLKEGYENIAYVSGYSDGTFRPDQSLSRAEAAVMLSRLLESEGIQGESKFSDTDMWAEEEIVILSELDVINGYSDDTFKPNNDITRGELAVIMSKILGLDINEDKAGFTDTENHWAENAIGALREDGIVNGYSDGSFKPDAVVTRVEAIAMINRVFEREDDEAKVYDNLFSDIDNNHWAFYLIMNAAGQ
ncbi:leucine-rich repeat protein [Vallitalea okinawensis]|uniref:leucine-rich repeat protein n=1 Tax=Vallitalea okinawensis TaxID=2078660 RepID=UPI000CFD490C|nr:leucine-rich repeat protein [Vallitalea okinawensis]